MKRSSLAWYVAVACLGGSLCVGPVVQADSPSTVKASSIVSYYCYNSGRPGSAEAKTAVPS